MPHLPPQTGHPRARWIVALVTRLALVALSIAALQGCQPAEPEFAAPVDPSGRTTLGELVFGVIHTNLGRAEECSEQYADAFAPHRDDFVAAFDHMLGAGLPAPLPEILGSVLLPLVDSGGLQALTDALASVLALLVDDAFDPERRTIAAALRLSQARGVIQGEDALRLASGVVGDRGLKGRLRSLAQVAQQHDGVDYTLDALLEMAGRRLSEAGEESNGVCAPLDPGDLEESALRTAGFVDDPALGAPAWAVRADVHGNPRVRHSDVDGILMAPFVDRDGDGAADVDAQGRPVNVAGQPVDLPPFGAEGVAVDAQGRPLASDGQLIYDYYDAKRTALSHAAQLGREAAEAGLHRDALALVEAALGQPVVCEDGTGTCRHYGADHPLADAVWLIVEVGRFERPLAFLDTMAVVLSDTPELADALFIAVGDIFEALDGVEAGEGLELTDPALIEVALDLLPLLDAIFSVDGAQTPLVLLDVVHGLGQTARDFPARLQLIIDHSALAKANACDGAGPDLARSTPVDYDQPRFFEQGGQRVDNRSGLEQVIELLDVADCGRVPLLAGGGHSVAYVVLDLIADMDPRDVCGLIDLVTAALPSLVTEIGLRLIGCGDDAGAVADALDSLDALTRSGALDFLIPLARVFKERGQLDTLIELLRFVAEDLQREQSVVRRALPSLSAALSSGAADPLFDLIDLLVTVEASDGQGTLADVMVESFARMVAEGPISTRAGVAQNSSLARELLLSALEIVERLRAQGAEGALSAIIDFLGQLLSAESQGERRALTHPNLRPLLGTLLGAVQELADLPRADYLCHMDRLQRDTDDALTGRDLATLVRLTRTLTAPGPGLDLEAWAIGALDPAPADPGADLYGPAMQLIAAILSTELADEDLGQLLRFVGRALQDRRGDGRDLMAVLDALLAADERDAILTMGRTLLTEDPAEGRRPLVAFSDAFGDLLDVKPERMCLADDLPPDPARVEEAVEGISGFMLSEGGLGAIYDLIGRRADSPR